MNVQQVLKNADADYIYKKFVSSCGEYIARKEMDNYRKLLKITSVHNIDKLLICTEKIDEKMFEYDYSIVESVGVNLYDKIDVYTKKIPTYEETLMPDFNKDCIYNQPLSFEPLENILGTDVSEISLETYGINACAYALYLEITSVEQKVNTMKDTMQVASKQYAAVNTRDVVYSLERDSYEDYINDILEENRMNIITDEYLNGLVTILREDIAMKNLAILNEILSMEKKLIKSKSVRVLVRL